MTKNDWKEVDTALDEAQAPLWYRARHFIAGFLIAALVSGLGVWLYRSAILQPKSNVDSENQVVLAKTDYDSLKIQIEELNKKVDEAKKTQSSSYTVTSKVAGASTSTVQETGGKININTADQTLLETLPGIGATYAQRIIDYRNTNGGFKTIDELDNVKGIGPATLEKLRQLVSL